MLSEHGITISPSTYYARSAAPSTVAELDDAYAAHEVSACSTACTGSSSCGAACAGGVATSDGIKWPA